MVCIKKCMHNFAQCRFTDSPLKDVSGLNEHEDQIALSPQKRVVPSSHTNTPLAQQCDQS